MFDPVASSVSLPQQEEKIIRFWKERQIYEKTLAARAAAPPFVFYEGPPTANGLPHPGHCLTRAIKDLFPRYKTMRGFCCQRKAGWDTHGLPVEVEVCKELGIHAKEEIEAYGVEPFIHKCIESVFRYMHAVGRTDRTARLLDPSRRGLRHLPPELRGERLVGAENIFRTRPALPGAQDRLVVGPRRHGPLQRRGRAGLPRSGRPQRFCAIPAGRSAGEPPRYGSARLDHHALDAAGNQFAAVKPDLEYSVLRFAGDSGMRGSG